LDCLRQLRKAIPLIYLVYFVKRETVAELILKGTCDCIKMGSISHLLAAIHRAQDEKILRDSRNRTEKGIGTVGSTLPRLGKKSKLRHLPLRSRRRHGDSQERTSGVLREGLSK
jgi:hypothetical protein